MSILFDYPSRSGAAFTDERRFSKSRGLSESDSFLPLPSLLFHFLALVSFLPRPKERPRNSNGILHRNQTETYATQAISEGTEGTYPQVNTMKAWLSLYLQWYYLWSETKQLHSHSMIHNLCTSLLSLMNEQHSSTHSLCSSSRKRLGEQQIHHLLRKAK